MTIATIYAGGIGDAIFPIIVLIVIIFQTIKASKKFSESKPGGAAPSEESPDSFSPEEELRKFLESLSGETGHQRERAPEEVIQKAPSEPTDIPAHQPPPVIRSIRTIQTVQPPHLPATQPVLQAITVSETVAPARKPLRVSKVLSRDVSDGHEYSVRSSLIRHLGNRRSLMEAVVLREILGPPLGLRR